MAASIAKTLAFAALIVFRNGQHHVFQTQNLFVLLDPKEKH